MGSRISNARDVKRKLVLLQDDEIVARSGVIANRYRSVLGYGYDITTDRDLPDVRGLLRQFKSTTGIPNILYTPTLLNKNRATETNRVLTSSYTFLGGSRTDGLLPNPIDGQINTARHTYTTSNMILRFPSTLNPDLSIPAGTYNFSIYLRYVSGDGTHVRIDYLNSPSSVVGTLTAISAGQDMGNGWFRHTLPVTMAVASAGGRMATNILRSDGSNPTSGIVEYFGVMVAIGQTVRRYQARTDQTATRLLNAGSVGVSGDATLLNGSSLTMLGRDLSTDVFRQIPTSSTVFTTTFRPTMTNGFSFCGWYKLNNVGNAQRLVCSTGFGIPGADILVFSNEILARAVLNGSNYIGRTTNAITGRANQWVHIAATFDGSLTSGGIKIFLNGTRVDTGDNNVGTYSHPALADPLVFGGFATGSDSVDGFSKYMAFWDSAISDANVNRIFNLQRSEFGI